MVRSHRTTTFATTVFLFLLASSAPAQSVTVGASVGAACSGNEFHCRDFGAAAFGASMRVPAGERWSFGARFDHISSKDTTFSVVVAPGDPAAGTHDAGVRESSRQVVTGDIGLALGSREHVHYHLVAGVALMRQSVRDRCEGPECAGLPSEVLAQFNADRNDWRGGIAFGGDVTIPVNTRWSVIGGPHVFIAAQGTSVVLYGGVVVSLGSS